MTHLIALAGQYLELGIVNDETNSREHDTEPKSPLLEGEY